MMKMIKKYPLLLFFAAFIMIFSVVDMVTPVRSESEMENRPLEQRPAISWRSLISEDDNQKYSIKYEKYTNDQFVLRDEWITLKSVSESLLGKLENNGIVYGAQKQMFEKYTSTDDWRIEKNIEFLNEFIAKYRDVAPITVGIIPSAYAVYPEKLPARLQNVDQTSYISKIYNTLPADVGRFDALSALEAGKEDYTYYRTDHHWTTSGAHRAYQALMGILGRDSVSMNALSGIATQKPDFYGTYYSKSKLFSAQPDIITYYDIPFDSITIDSVERSALYEIEKWDTRDKYSAFLWGNNGLTVIKSSNNLVSEAGETSRVLLVKDSFGNCFAPFLTYSYDEVYVVDARSIAKLSETLGETEFDDIIVMYNFMNFASDTNVARLTY